jgi:hypothetical protein
VLCYHLSCRLLVDDWPAIEAKEILGIAVATTSPKLTLQSTVSPPHKRDLGNDAQFLECLLNSQVGHLVALNHERLGRLGSLVGMAGIVRRRQVILNPELDCLRDLRSSKFGDNAEREVNS